MNKIHKFSKTVAAIGLAAIVLAISANLTAEVKQPETKPATQPASLPPLEKVYEDLKLTQNDKEMLAKLRDGTEGNDEKGFYWMMAKVAKLPKLTLAELAQLDAPSWANMLRSPDRYRYQPIRMNVRIFTVQELTVAQNRLTATPHWSSDKSIWRILCTNADAKEKHEEQPLIVYCDTKPADLPQKSVRQGENSVGYPKGPQYTIAGVFLKYVEADDTSGNPRKFPVILAWQMDKSKAKVAAADTTIARQFISGAIFLALVLGGVTFYMLKKRLKKQKHRPAGHHMFREYKPLRNEQLEEGEEEELTEVDPDLAAAAAKYRKEHGLDDEPKKS